MGLVNELDKMALEKKLGKGRGKMLFLGQMEEIKAALDKGYSIKTVWSHLHNTDRMPVGYASFTTYVSKYLNNSTGRIAQSKEAKPELQAQVTKKPTEEPRVKLPRGLGTSSSISKQSENPEDFPDSPIFDSK